MKRELPKLSELHHDPETAFKNDELNLLLNQSPHERWIKKHPIITVLNDEGKQTKLQYLPVEKVEFLLTRIFQEWRREVKDIQLCLNSMVATVRIHYKNPVTGEWSYHDGVGACPIQTDKDAKAGDFSALKTSGVQMAAPSAVSYALKDAADCLGKLFGKDLNRRDTSAFSGAYSSKVQTSIETAHGSASTEDATKGTPVTQASIKAKYTPPANPTKDEDDFDL
jgi:hypothetical protein